MIYMIYSAFFNVLESIWEEKFFLYLEKKTPPQKIKAFY